MKDYANELNLFDIQELNLIHSASLDILADPGMKICSAQLRTALKEAGAQVNDTSEVVRFPNELIERTLNSMKAQIETGKEQNVLNGVIASRTPRKMGVKFGGACIEYYDWEKQSAFKPNRSQLVDLVRLGEALPEVAVVGNPVMYLFEDDGTPVEPRMQRVKTAAIIARYTNKAGPTEVWNAEELKYLIELGEIVRGGHEAYIHNPCFITAKETIAPLVLNQEAGDVLCLLAQHDLPCTVIPMPVTGVSSPMTIASNITLANAEMLGTFTAIRSAVPTANCVGGIISGTFDMKTTAIALAAPESVLQDLGVAELHERLYGFKFGIGGYIDAKYPGAQAAMEAMGRYAMMARLGRYNVPCGLLSCGKRFSIEQALVDIEIERWLVEVGKGIEVNEATLLVDQIRKVGIGGSSLGEDHTLQFMRKNVWYPELMDRWQADNPETDLARDIIESASKKIKRILKQDNLYEADSARIRAIDAVTSAAERHLQS